MVPNSHVQTTAGVVGIVPVCPCSTLSGLAHHDPSPPKKCLLLYLLVERKY